MFLFGMVARELGTSVEAVRLDRVNSDCEAAAVERGKG